MKHTEEGHGLDGTVFGLVCTIAQIYLQLRKQWENALERI